ncbi:hypothetical protein ACH5RR_040635 [Cinchona calisaya]|uniref:Late blight resistance protein homolog R1A-3 n=1 Tax=Cinchona calisaya TaxID=153742 RepID=A0ABD2XT24_9GENT
MASSTCFHSALVDLQFLENISPYYYMVYYELLSDGIRKLRTFHLYARKWGNNDDVTLGALLVRIEDAVSKIAQEFHPICLILEDENEASTEILKQADGHDHLDDFSSFTEEINQWYINFADCSGLSCSPDRDELVEFMDSLLDKPMYNNFYLFSYDAESEVLVELHEALEEKLRFLKNFIWFTKLQDIDCRHLGHLFTHIKSVAINAAHIYYTYQFINYDYNRMEMQFKISGLLKRVKPTDPQDDEIYIQVLNASILSRQSHTVMLEMDKHILDEFVDSLLSNLWEIITSGSFPMFLMKDRLQILYEELRFLRTHLKEQADNFDKKLGNLIGVVVCDAGLVIFSLFLDAIEDGLAKEMDRVLFDLLESIKLIRAKVALKSPQGSTIFNFPKVDELGFIDFLLENLTELKSCEAGSVALAKHQIHTIQEELVFLRPFLGKIKELHTEQEDLEGIWNRVVELAYTTEFFIDSLVIGDILDSSPTSLDSIIEEIKIIKLDALKIMTREGLDIKEKKVTKRSYHLPFEKSMPTIKDDIVGLDDEATSIMDRLKRGAQQLQIVAIVGMPGIGKTTLAKRIYNDASIMSHFHIRAWCCISQVYDKKNLLLEILTYIFGKLSDKHFKMSEENLALELYRSLKRNRYLIVLDDVWDIDAWNSLEASFPNDGNGSRIIVTSRHLDVAPKDKLDQEPHLLRQLTDDESWKLLKAKLFPGDDWPPTLCEVGVQIVERCKGLPLTIVILAGILATMEQDGWKEVLEHLSSSTVSGTQQCKNMLDLSYRHLPDKLKPCLLYFGAFPEDQELTTKKLTWLWIAEGFVCQTQSKSLEDKAKDYLMHLVSRSLVMVAKQSSTGGVKTCRIHDLLHEFCVEKAKEERFFQLLKGYDELSGFNEPHNLRRLCIYSRQDHFKESRLFCPRVRCLLFFDRGYGAQRFNLSFFIRIFKLVRVLDFSQIFLGFTFPSEIGLLVHLRYLAVRGRIYSIPSSIANLWNLETFIVESFEDVVLPDTIWNLKKLRHLEIKNGSLACLASFSFLKDNLDGSAELCNMDTFSIALLSWQNQEKIMRKFPNIRKLKAKILEDGASAGESNKILVLDYLSQLESLQISPFKKYGTQCEIDFCFSLNIRKLTLSGFCLPWCKISAIGNLPNLEVLKLIDNAFMGDIWNMEEPGQFTKVSFLKLASLGIVKWIASESEDHFPRLVKLVLESCTCLEEVPSCFGDISTLQIIEVSDCSDSATSSVMQIQEEQVSMGNELKVLVSSSNRSSN